MAKKRLTVKEKTAIRTKPVRDLFDQAIEALTEVSTGYRLKEARWLDEMNQARECLRYAINGDFSKQDQAEKLITIYKNRIEDQSYGYLCVRLVAQGREARYIF